MSRHGDCKVYVGDLGNNASKPELEDAFSYYGPLRNVWVARNPPGFAFVEFEDPRDAEDAVSCCNFYKPVSMTQALCCDHLGLNFIIILSQIRGLDGRTICGRRARVEMSNGSRGYGGRGGPPPRSRLPPRPYDDRCYDCGDRGHYARDCTRRRRRRYTSAYTCSGLELAMFRFFYLARVVLEPYEHFETSVLIPTLSAGSTTRYHQK